MCLECRMSLGPLLINYLLNILILFLKKYKKSLKKLTIFFSSHNFFLKKIFCKPILLIYICMI